MSRRLAATGFFIMVLVISSTIATAVTVPVGGASIMNMGDDVKVSGSISGSAPATYTVELIKESSGASINQFAFGVRKVGNAFEAASNLSGPDNSLIVTNRTLGQSFKAEFMYKFFDVMPEGMTYELRATKVVPLPPAFVIMIAGVAALAGIGARNRLRGRPRCQGATALQA